MCPKLLGFVICPLNPQNEPLCPGILVVADDEKKNPPGVLLGPPIVVSIHGDWSFYLRGFCSTHQHYKTPRDRARRSPGRFSKSTWHFRFFVISLAENEIGIYHCVYPPLPLYSFSEISMKKFFFQNFQKFWENCQNFQRYVWVPPGGVYTKSENLKSLKMCSNT